MGAVRALAVVTVLLAAAAAVLLQAPLAPPSAAAPTALGPWAAAEGPQVVALRGSRTLSPENSVAAHHAAANLGADLLHADLLALGDGRARVLSAAALAALAPGRAPSSLAEAELDGLDVAAAFEAAGRGRLLAGKGLRPPRLLEWMSRFRAAPVLLELQGRAPSAADDLVRGLNAFMAATQLEGQGEFSERLEDRIIVSAQSLAVTQRVREAFEGRVATVCAPEEALLLLWATQWPQLWPLVEWAAPSWRECAVVQAPAQIGRHTFATAAFVEAAHRLGKRVVLGVANEEATMRRLLALGADGLLTDRPDLAHALLAEQWPGREERRQRLFAGLGSYEVPLHNTGAAADQLDFFPLPWAPLLRAEPALLAGCLLLLLALPLYVLLGLPAALLRLLRPAPAPAQADAAQAKAAKAKAGGQQAKAATQAKAGQQGLRKRK